MDVNTQGETHMQTHFTLLFIGADCISFFFLTTGCLTVSIKQRNAATDQIIFTHTHTYTLYVSPLLLLGKLSGPTGPTACKNVDGRRYFWPSALKGGYVWVTEAVVWGCARDAPGMWREGGGGGERWFTRGPSILRVSMDAHSVRLVWLMCVTLAWRVMEGGVEGREGGRGGSSTLWTENKREDILVLDSWFERRQLDEIVWGQKCLNNSVCLIPPLCLLPCARVGGCVFVCALFVR